MNTSGMTGKKVLIRVDFNVPLDASRNVTDDTRIQRALPTIKKVLESGAAVILMSHLGRPKLVSGQDNTEQIEKNTLRHIVPHLSKVLGTEVLFSADTVGQQAYDKSLNIAPGQVLLLENTRFEEGEKKGDDDMAAKLAKLADFYINDAFGTAHRKHASTYTVAKYFEKENRQL